MAVPDYKYSDAYWERLVNVYIEQLKENPKSYVYVPLADALVYLGRINDAIETLTWGLTKLPESRAAKVMLAQLLYDVGDVAGAKLLLEDITGRWPDVTEAVSLLCKIYESEGDTESAQIKSAALLKYYPDSGPVRKMAGYYSQPSREKPERSRDGRAALKAEPPREDRADQKPAEPSAGAENMGAKKAEKEVLSALEKMLERVEAIKAEVK